MSRNLSRPIYIPIIAVLIVSLAIGPFSRLKVPNTRVSKLPVDYVPDPTPNRPTLFYIHPPPHRLTIHSFVTSPRSIQSRDYSPELIPHLSWFSPAPNVVTSHPRGLHSQFFFLKFRVYFFKCHISMYQVWLGRRDWEIFGEILVTKVLLTILSLGTDNCYIIEDF